MLPRTKRYDIINWCRGDLQSTYATRGGEWSSKMCTVTCSARLQGFMPYVYVQISFHVLAACLSHDVLYYLQKFSLLSILITLDYFC